MTKTLFHVYKIMSIYIEESMDDKEGFCSVEWFNILCVYV